MRQGAGEELKTGLAARGNLPDDGWKPGCYSAASRLRRRSMHSSHQRSEPQRRLLSGGIEFLIEWTLAEGPDGTAVRLQLSGSPDLPEQAFRGAEYG